MIFIVYYIMYTYYIRSVYICIYYVYNYINIYSNVYTYIICLSKNSPP
jgi:hypothetical protein